MTTPQYQSYGNTTLRSKSSPSSRLEVFKKPPDPELLAKVRRKKVKVLDEDHFVEEVEKIIERDFFPELEKLKAQSEYIDAKARNDFATMSRLQEKFSGCRPSTSSGGRLTSPATFETPEEPMRNFDPRRPQDKENEKKMLTDTDEKEEESVNLDKFLANHTSEDNESFHELQKEAEVKHRLKNAWMYKDENEYLAKKSSEMSLPSIEEQAALPIKPEQLETWTYQNINSVFHNPDTLELSYEEKLELSKKQKEIKHKNTSLTKQPWKSGKQMEILRREAEKQKEIAAGKVGADGKEIVRPQTPMVNGFKLVSMAPSPAIGVADSPLMTWGEVESTPYRLEGEKTPLFPSAGPGFTIKDVPERDRIAKELADKNSKYYRDRKQKALEQAKSSLKVGRPGSGRPNSSLPNLSPAAKRLVSTKLGIRLGTDEMLRASYTPSPARKHNSTPTPRNVRSTPTPKGKRTSTSNLKNMGDITDNLLNIKQAQPVHRRPVEEPVDINTDNLLNINQPKRPRAQDFFKNSFDT